MVCEYCICNFGLCCFRHIVNVIRIQKGILCALLFIAEIAKLKTAELHFAFQVSFYIFSNMMRQSFFFEIEFTSILFLANRQKKSLDRLTNFLQKLIEYFIALSNECKQSIRDANQMPIQIASRTQQLCYDNR